jgi:UDP-N-acetyl-2-amino-2-deoxyglucuronate dehydrogenase
MIEFIVTGVGWAGERHARAVQTLAQSGVPLRLAALVDSDPVHLQRQRETLGVKDGYLSLAEALTAHPQAGAVVLATPHHLHRAGTEMAAAAGRHVLVEKPMATSLQDADAMIAACHANQVTLMVAESVRFQPLPRQIAQIIQAGTLGEVLNGRINFIRRGYDTYSYPGRRAWMSDPAVVDGGIWLVNGIHDMSAARMLFGEVVSVYAEEVRSARFGSPLESTVIATVRFAGGAAITMTVSAELKGYGIFGDIAVFGTNGSLHALWKPDAREIDVYHGEDRHERVSLPVERSLAGDVPANFVRQMEEFAAAIVEKRPPLTSGESERATLAAILAGYESIRSGKPVRL